MKKILVTIILGVMLSLCACGNSNEGVDVSHGEMESGNYVENNVSEQEVEIVELTMDNWQEYYEFTVSIREERDEFGDLEMVWITEIIDVKEEYKGKVVDVEDVAFKVMDKPWEEDDYYTMLPTYRYRYDITTGEYTRTYVGVDGEEHDVAHEHVFEPYEDLFIPVSAEFGYNVGRGTIEGNYWEFDCYENDYIVLNVKGKLHIIKE